MTSVYPSFPMAGRRCRDGDCRYFRRGLGVHQEVGGGVCELRVEAGLAAKVGTIAAQCNLTLPNNLCDVAVVWCFRSITPAIVCSCL